MGLISNQIKGKGVWFWAAVSVLLIVTVLFSSQAFSAAMSVTAQPLQNAGDGDLTYTSDYSGASATITRHESTDFTLNVSDQITDVIVQGTKASGAVDVKIDLRDASATLLDTATVALPSGAESYNKTVITLGTVPYHTVTTVEATYTSSGPVTLTLNPTGGWDNKDLDTLSNLGTFGLVQTSNNQWLLRDGVYWTSFQFDQTVPAGATIVSVKVYVEHWEDNGSKAGDLTWEIGTGTLSSPTVLGSTTPTVVTGSGSEVVAEWIVTTWIDTEAEANDLKLKVTQNNSKGKKANLDNVYVVVEYNP